MGAAGVMSGGFGACSIERAINGDSAKSKELRETMKNFKKLKPGEKYDFSGSLSLVKTVYVIRDDRQREASRDCWTGSTKGSNRTYTLGYDFNL